jgi:hypothetical protein
MHQNDSDKLSKHITTMKSFLYDLKAFEIIFVTLVVLSLIGVGITDFSPARSYWYWFTMAPIYAGACLFMEWSQARREGTRALTIIRTQLFTWLGLLVAIQVVFLLLRSGRLTYESTGLVILLLLALTTFIAGIHLGYELCMLGGFLGLTVLMVAYLEQYVWVIVFLAIIGAIVIFYVARRKFKSRETRT